MSPFEVNRVRGWLVCGIGIIGCTLLPTGAILILFPRTVALGLLTWFAAVILSFILAFISLGLYFIGPHFRRIPMSLPPRGYGGRSYNLLPMDLGRFDNVAIRSLRRMKALVLR